MSASFGSPRHVEIGDAASFAGTTPRAIRYYHEIGLLPEPARGGDDRRRYGYEDLIRLLWIRRLADAGVALSDIGAASADPASADDAGEVAGILERLESTLAAREAELQRQRAAVQRMRERGTRLGLLSDVVTHRLESLPGRSLRQSDLDALLVTERILGPLGAAVQATRFIALASDPVLREESDRVDAAEEALDHTVAVDDPRVATVAAARRAFEVRLHAAIESSGLAQSEEALLDRWEATSESTGDQGEKSPGSSARSGSMSALEAIGKLPYDVSPARLWCMELAGDVVGGEMSASVT